MLRSVVAKEATRDTTMEKSNEVRKSSFNTKRSPASLLKQNADNESFLRPSAKMPKLELRVVVPEGESLIVYVHPNDDDYYDDIFVVSVLKSIHKVERWLLKCDDFVPDVPGEEPFQFHLNNPIRVFSPVVPLSLIEKNRFGLKRVPDFRNDMNSPIFKRFIRIEHTQVKNIVEECLEKKPLRYDVI